MLIIKHGSLLSCAAFLPAKTENGFIKVYLFLLRQVSLKAKCQSLSDICAWGRQLGMLQLEGVKETRLKLTMSHPDLSSRA